MKNDPARHALSLHRDALRLHTLQALEQGFEVFQAFYLAPCVEDHVSTLLGVLDPRPGSHILDIGCGVGGITCHFFLQDRTLKFYNLNIDENQLSYIPRPLHPICGDGYRLPFKEESFDALLYLFSMGYMEIDALQEAYRVLRKGGRVMIYDMLATWPHNLAVAKYRSYSQSFMEGMSRSFGFRIETIIPTLYYSEEQRAFAGSEQFDFLFQNTRPILYLLTK